MPGYVFVSAHAHGRTCAWACACVSMGMCVRVRMCLRVCMCERVHAFPCASAVECACLTAPYDCDQVSFATETKPAGKLLTYDDDEDTHTAQ